VIEAPAAREAAARRVSLTRRKACLTLSAARQLADCFVKKIPANRTVFLWTGGFRWRIGQKAGQRKPGNSPLRVKRSIIRAGRFDQMLSAEIGA